MPSGQGMKWTGVDPPLGGGVVSSAFPQQAGDSRNLGRLSSRAPFSFFVEVDRSLWGSDKHRVWEHLTRRGFANGHQPQQ